MVKKQTVWLLTMLSLMIVLSVYYMTAPEGDEMTFINDDGWELNEDGEEASTDGDATGDTVISQMSTDEMFVALRMEAENKRDELHEMYSSIVASTNSSSKEKNEALEQMQQLQEMQHKESVLETNIQANAEYEDVLVRAEDEKVHVTVKANELSNQETNAIMKMVYDEFGEKTVIVQFQPQS
ncbi:SpoIIIAH-like family protein [Thalassobacillus hwangdonensis]|uniref:SpoIIIAH-like family protein n=1 Tax=Thalassobacillus hwangdonensis TaxID=546108 RepID=A0ABW3KYG5_9BACI